MIAKFKKIKYELHTIIELIRLKGEMNDRWGDDRGGNVKVSDNFINQTVANAIWGVAKSAQSTDFADKIMEAGRVQLKEAYTGMIDAFDEDGCGPTWYEILLELIREGIIKIQPQPQPQPWPWPKPNWLDSITTHLDVFNKFDSEFAQYEKYSTHLDIYNAIALRQLASFTTNEEVSKTLLDIAPKLMEKHIGGKALQNFIDDCGSTGPRRIPRKPVLAGPLKK